MTAIKVNADYESQLFFGRPGPVIVNQSLEFLALFLDERPLFTSKKYSSDYLEYITSVTGRRPYFVYEGDFVNWWGPLKDIDKEKILNSKITSTELNIREGWCEDTFIIKNEDDFKKLNPKSTYLLKNPYGMSGQKFQIYFTEDRPVPGEWIAEPLLNRRWDFSHYVYPDGRVCAYQNLIDDKFQYKGTIVGPELPFINQLKDGEWKKFQEALKVIINFYHDPQSEFGFSVDSFVYEENGEFKIRFLCEVNYRRTMGCVALDLAQKYSDRSWGLFLLGKNLQHEGIKLSPGDTRFDMVFSDAMTREELLTNSKLSIEI